MYKSTHGRWPRLPYVFMQYTSKVWSLVYTCTVVMKPRSFPKLSINALPQRQDNLWWRMRLSSGFISSLTPRTTVMSSPLAGAEMITFIMLAMSQLTSRFTCSYISLIVLSVETSLCKCPILINIKPYCYGLPGSNHRYFGLLAAVPFSGLNYCFEDMGYFCIDNLPSSLFISLNFA